MTNAQERLNYLMSLERSYAGYSEDKGLLILSTDPDLVRDVIRRYSKEHKTKATFGVPVEK